MVAGQDFTDVLPKYAFWDVNRENLDFSQDKTFIISRLFERGKLDDVLSVIVLYGKVEAGNVFTLELGVYANGEHGAIGLEEDVLVTSIGIEWLSTPQTRLELVR